MPNCTVQLVVIDRQRLAELSNILEKLDKKLKDKIGRSNDIIFSYSEAADFNPLPSSFEHREIINRIPKFEIAAFEYSGMR
jgi:hypothetical protein